VRILFRSGFGVGADSLAPHLERIQKSLDIFSADPFRASVGVNLIKPRACEKNQPSEMRAVFASEANAASDKSVSDHRLGTNGGGAGVIRGASASVVEDCFDPVPIVVEGVTVQVADHKGAVIHFERDNVVAGKFCRDLVGACGSCTANRPSSKRCNCQSVEAIAEKLAANRIPNKKIRFITISDERCREASR
jgi:hypothetical protein